MYWSLQVVPDHSDASMQGGRLSHVLWGDGHCVDPLILQRGCISGKRLHFGMGFKYGAMRLVRIWGHVHLQGHQQSLATPQEIFGKCGRTVLGSMARVASCGLRVQGSPCLGNPAVRSP